MTTEEQSGQLGDCGVTVRAYHVDNDPAEISDLLEIKPAKTQRVGDSSSLEGLAVNLNGWFLESAVRVASQSFDAHLNWIIEQLMPKAVALAELRRRGWAVDVMACWSEGGFGGPKFTPEQMGALSHLGLGLWVVFGGWSEQTWERTRPRRRKSK